MIYYITPREEEILNLLIEGMTNNQISESLSIKTSTVSTHLRNLFKKCNVKSRYSLAYLYGKNNQSFKIKKDAVAS